MHLDHLELSDLEAKVSDSQVEVSDSEVCYAELGASDSEVEVGDSKVYHDPSYDKGPKIKLHRVSILGQHTGVL